ncbi:OmpA family protein [Porphyromonas sp.]|uniref:OmpA family protein n=1 Tax=Porphyromonas sp. TaxID=1924944 RepID=UPI0026DDC838|nr:OmpA family protein [Porphyromonas sp.]MDO4770590.1 OmpA family protein [Porphyromonas sp.]
MKKTTTFLGAAFLSFAMMFSGCGLNNAAKGSGIGLGAGAAIGAGVGKALGNTGLGAVIGAAVGGAAGGIIGNKMDKQKKELEQAVPEATIETVNNGEVIRVTFDSGILFATNSSTLSAASRTALIRFAQNMNENPDTDIRIVGHTDITGRHEYNMTLSKKRADSVYNHLINNGVAPARMISIGMGPDEPVADNATVQGRAQNRRVEVYILPNAKMIEEAKKGT